MILGRDQIVRSISYGGHTKTELLQDLTEHKIGLNAYSVWLFDLGNFDDPAPPQIAETIELTVAQLGLKEGGTAEQIFILAASLGLKLCPIEIGPYLRLSSLDQDEGPWTTIASAKPSDDLESPNGFYLQNMNGILWLRGYRASEDHVFGPEERFVFCCP